MYLENSEQNLVHFDAIMFTAFGPASHSNVGEFEQIQGFSFWFGSVLYRELTIEKLRYFQLQNTQSKDVAEKVATPFFVSE